MNNFANILKDVDEEKFSSTVRLLLTKTFLIRNGAGTDSEYLFCVKNRRLVEDYLELMRYDLSVMEKDGVALIQDRNDSSVVNFLKNEAIFCLILRSIFYEKERESMENLSSVKITLNDILENYYNHDFPKMKKDTIISSLRTMKKYNLITNEGRLDSCNPDMPIRIFPSIKYMVITKAVDNFNETLQGKIDAYKTNSMEEDLDD